jgi:predicted phosphodiesterase
MRIAILSDIHSNLPALSKALSIIGHIGVDELYCLGDIVGYGAMANECVDLIRTHATRCVVGNHDLAAIDPSQSNLLPKPGRLAALWTNKILSRENTAYLSSLPFRIETKSVTLVHANPARPEEWAYVGTLDDAVPQFAHFRTPLCFIGHTHIPFVCGEDLKTFYLRKGIRSLVNVGSIGQPRDGNPQLSFGILDTDAWSFEAIRADYDIETAAQAIIKNGLPDILANRLFRGI